MSEIAIFSTSFDEPTYGSVVEVLSSKGYDTWVYRADKIASGEDNLSVRLDGEEELTLNYNGLVHNLGAISSAWFRHPNLLNLDLEDKAKQMCIEQEISSLQESFWQQVPEHAWMNHPTRMKMAQAKLAQLVLANQLGFETPKTVTSNGWDCINKTLGSDEIIVKMPKGLVYERDQTKVLYTTVIDQQQRDHLKANNPFPAIYQEYLQKQKEWRVTVVGDDVFEVAIYTSDDAKDDWRIHQFTPKVEFKKESIPETERARCIEFLGRMGLVYGAFDFIEDKDGKLTFLECNTNGQYKWLEEILDLRISDAIAGTLIKNYKKNQ